MFFWLVLAACAVHVHAAQLHVNRFVPSEDPHHFDTEMDNKYASETVELAANTTALVLIDVWNDQDDPILTENEVKRVLPLLTAARQLGLFIIHAPSSGTLWRNISVLPGEVLVTGEDGRPQSASRCDGHLRNSGIKHVLIAGYDTNYCVVDKPCGVVSLSKELAEDSEIILLKDATRPQPFWYHNAWFSLMMGTNMLESGYWLPPPKRFIRSTAVAEFFQAFGVNTTLDALQYPQPAAGQLFHVPAPIPAFPRGGSGERHAALVVVSCTSDWANDGFRARVEENIENQLGPLLLAARKSGAILIIHALNGHVPAPDCAPMPGEFVANSTAQFDAFVEKSSIETLLYAGYAANRDMLFGVAGMQRYYSDHRYLRKKVPNYYWIAEATVGLEIAESLEGNWGKKVALAYRQPLLTSSGNILASEDVKQRLCSMAPHDDKIFAFSDVRHFASKNDAVVDQQLLGGCGTNKMIDHETVTIDMYAAPDTLNETDKKMLCFRKSTGTPFAVYQLRMGDMPGELFYQVAAKDWSTIAIPNFFRVPGQRVRITVIHAGSTVKIFRDGLLVKNTTTFQRLDYTNAEAMVVGWRAGQDFWEGSIGPVLISNGSVPPSGSGSGLVESEYAALVDIWNSCGGSNWKYMPGTDAVGRGREWMIGDPCIDGWFGVKCDDVREHVVMLFPNTRNSGNPLHCELPLSIGNLTHLEHLYTSNDVSPSSLYGGIPETLGNLKHLKCMYFSHNKLSLPIPKSLELLTELQVFLMRQNHITGALINFTKLPKLRNVWLDGNKLTGSLESLGTLSQLTYLEAANNDFTGSVPKSLCGIKCLAAGNNLTCSDDLPKGCCQISSCGSAAPAPPPVEPSMGECFPQLPFQDTFI